MNQEYKTEWLAALRSGEYDQGKFKLKHKDNTFCCLGVLCDLYLNKNNLTWEDFPKNVTGENSEIFFKRFNEFDYLPLSLEKELGINKQGKFPFGKPMSTPDGQLFDNLADLNDSQIFNFSEFADIIEKRF
jgi:hypothetical protein